LKCRHCGSPLKLEFLDLGVAPPSNAYLTAEQVQAPEVWLPLRLMVCQSCWLVQTLDCARSDALFTGDYAYFSSFSSSWLDHSRKYATEMIARFGLDANSSVCEVAANDGYLLQYFKADGVSCYGVEPTASTAKAARAKGIEIVESFFGRDLARSLVEHGRSVDLTAANNVLAHVPDINDFVGGFATLLKPNGVSTFEFPHLLEMARNNQFDTAYHEHYSYLSLTAVAKIFAENGLSVFDVQKLPTHGGSLRVFAQRRDSGVRPVEPSVAALIADEEAAGVRGADFYGSFQGRAEQIKDDALAFLIEAKRKGNKVGAYGAAAKGNTLLNFSGVKPDLIPYVVDRNPAKQTQYMPGSRIPIVPESRLIEDRPDIVVILPWNLRDELTKQLGYVKDWGGRFVTFVPELTVW
jgi:2-polyprenyl-3-methyl-5-hydroxy-6-metoxy-1,4-benzoquinol methylase